MRCNRDDCNHILAGAVVPEDAIGSGRVVFGVGFEDDFIVESAQVTEFVRPQSGMAWI